MRNLTPGPILFAAAVAAIFLFIALAVSPIGYAKAETVSAAENQKGKRNLEKGKISVKSHRSTDYKNWESEADVKDENDLYSSELDPSGSDSYEGDGYGYDDDEYDHFNDKRYDSKLEENKNSVDGDKRGNVALPEATTIELLSFQAKNMNPMSENVQPTKEDQKVKQFSLKKPPYSEKAEEKDALVDEKLKKKTTTEEQKPNENASDKNTGNVKVSETKETPENKLEKGKVSDPGSNSQTNVRNLKENEQMASANKENSLRDDKSEAKFAEKDVNAAEVKIQSEEKMKVEKDTEAKIDGDATKLAESLPESNYKERFDNMNDPVITDDEKDSEDNGINLAGLRDSRNELPYQYPNKYLKKKEAGRRNWKNNRRETCGKSVKEPFHLEFPVADLDSTDYHRNYVKSLKKLKNTEDSARILAQGDTPNPYADDARKHLASRVIEEEQRKRRSRLRRLKANPVFKRRDEVEQEEEDDYQYDSRPLRPLRYRMNTRNIIADGCNQPEKSYRRRGNYLLRDGDQLEEEETKNVKNKRQDDAGYAEKRRSGGETVGQKKKLKEESSRYNNPLVLLQRSDNGQQAMKTFIDGRYKNEDGIDSDDLARLLSRDSNYVVLKKVPGKEQLQALHEQSKSGFGDSRKEKYKISGETSKLVSTLKEERGERPIKRKENRIEDLSDFFKGDVNDDKDLDEKKEMMISIDNRLNQYRKGEPNKKLMYKPSLSQVYRHMKDFDGTENVSDSALTDKKITGKNSERLMKSSTKEGKEYLILNKPLATMFKSQDSTVSNSVTTPNLEQSPSMMTGDNVAPTGEYHNYQEIKLPEAMQNGMNANRRYFLYGSENDNTPKHEVRVMQGDLSMPSENGYNMQNYNPQQSYNKPSSNVMKNTQSGKTQQPFVETGMNGQCNYGKCLLNGYQSAGGLSSKNLKRLAKKNDLERFVRDFQDFSQGSYPNTYKSTDLPGMTLQELTTHGDRQLQKLNNLLKEIMSNRAQENGGDKAANNLKRGIFQKYKEQKNWQVTPAQGEGEAQVRSGKWTSVVYDDATNTGYSDKSISSDESLFKDRKYEGKDPAAILDKDNLSLGKRTKRQSGYDSKDSTKILEQKVKSVPYNVQPQPLLPGAGGTGNANTNTNQQHKSPSRTCLQLPPDKLMDLLSFFTSEREHLTKEDNMKDYLCKRNSPAAEEPFLGEPEKKRAECVRKSFQSYLDPLVRKMEERSRRKAKREIDLDESMPNDFHNFLVTSLGEFDSEKRGIVNKNEDMWDSEENIEESTLRKRDTTGNKKNSISKEDATNIRIKIVDGNGDGELGVKATENAALSKTGAADSGEDRIHQVYLITGGDSKRKKKKFASITNDQSPQKQSISKHLPQVETVYNPSPGSNKAQVEKISSSDSQLKGKCAQPPTVYNATPSTMDEDNIIRNNLRTGNINTFTYQQKEEATPYPLQGPTNTPSSEFEMLNSKSLSRSKPFNTRLLDYGEHYTSPTLSNGNPEIIYKDENHEQYTKPNYRSNPVVRVFTSRAEGSSGDGFRTNSGEVEEYEEGDLDRQADSDYEEYPQPQEHLDPKMVALWNDYARTHLSPERHKEAMEREFQEAFYRSNAQVRYVGNLNQPNFGGGLTEDRQKLTKRLTAVEPTQIGRRFFYTFKSEIPDEEYYSLYREPSESKTKIGNERVRITKNWVANNRQPMEEKENRVKRSEERTKMEKRLSSGHLTENHYRKYHKKNLNEKVEEEYGERVKRDSLSDFLKADMMRRIEEEKKVRSKVKGLSSDLTKNDIPFIGSFTSGEEVIFSDPSLQSPAQDQNKNIIDQNPYLQIQQQYGNGKTGTPDVFKTFEIKRGRREQKTHSIVARDESDIYRDRVFLKGVTTRKVKKYSDEGFETLAPDTRFYAENNEPYTLSLHDKQSNINRRAGDKNSKLNNAQQKLHKLTHGFSHEAPLLTPNTPLNSPKIFDALKDSPPPNPGNHPPELSPIQSHVKSTKESTEEPLVSAVLVLTKREESRHGGIEGDHPMEEEKSSQVEKRSPHWIKHVSDGDSSGVRQIAASPQIPEIVSEEGKCRGCGNCETPTKTSNNKIASNCRQSCFRFTQIKNDIGNSGEDILESILGRVESNPHFRRVIGPGLKWRNRKCYSETTEEEPDRCHQPPNKCLFVRQVRKILAKFVRDMENLATQDFTRNVCCKLDCRSNKFLRELLQVPYEPSPTCNRRKYLGSLSKVASGNTYLTAASVKTTENRREVVARLLEEYRNLPDDEKKSVEMLGQYLNHELVSLDRALNTEQPSPANNMYSSEFPGDGEAAKLVSEEREKSGSPSSSRTQMPSLKDWSSMVNGNRRESFCEVTQPDKSRHRGSSPEGLLPFAYLNVAKTCKHRSKLSFTGS